MRMKNSLNFVLIALLLVVLGCSCSRLAELGKKKNEPSSTPASTPYSTSTPTPTTSKSPSSNAAGLTREKADQIKNGMSRKDVENVLGEGEEVSTTEGGGMKFLVMKWTDSKFNYVIVSFKNDKAYNITKSVKK